MSVLLSSHMLERVQSVCDRVALFDKGSIVLIGTVPELGRQVLGGGFHVEVEAEGQGLAERLATVPGVTTVEATGTNRMRLLAERDVRPDAAAAVVAAGGRLLNLSIEEPSLAVIYARYFQNAASREGFHHAPPEIAPARGGPRNGRTGSNLRSSRPGSRTLPTSM